MFLELNPEAFPADECIRQKMEFNRLEVLGNQKTLAQQRYCKIDEAAPQVSTPHATSSSSKMGRVRI